MNFFSKYFILLYTVAVLLFALLFFTKHSNAYEYKVFGVNTKTNERIIGQIEDSNKNGSLTGVVWDRDGVFTVEGAWSGKGLMELHSNATRFEAEVVE